MDPKSKLGMIRSSVECFTQAKIFNRLAKENGSKLQIVVKFVQRDLTEDEALTIEILNSKI